jgi:hypothetical protein
MTTEHIDRITETLAAHWSFSTDTTQSPFVDRCDGCKAALYTHGGEWVSAADALGTHQAAALAPVVDAMLAQARRQALLEAADAWTQGGWSDTPRRADRVADRMAAAQFAGDWLRARAGQVSQ